MTIHNHDFDGRNLPVNPPVGLPAQLAGTSLAVSGSVAEPVLAPVHLPIGLLFFVDDRKVRLEAVADDRVVDLIDQRTMGRLQTRDPDTGALTAPTLDWLREMYRLGRLRPVTRPETTGERQGRHALLDPEAAVDRDPKSTWRFSLASRAAAAGIDLTDAAADEWLVENYGRVATDLAFAKPSGSSLRRWMRYLAKRGTRTASLVACTGRPRGRSQLDPVVDALVHEAALFYWTRRNAQMAHAYAWLDEQITHLNAARPAGSAALRTPAKETLRQRVHKLRCFDTVAAKTSVEEAERLFKGSGDRLLVSELHELALIDGTTLEQVVVFDDDWALPACRVRIVALMDALSHAITGFHVYAGPNRSEASLEAIIAAVTPPLVDPARLRDHPMLAWIFGKPARILGDNEKALIGPSSLPSLLEAGIDVVPAPVNTPTAKASLERFWRTLEEALKQIPGSLMDPRRAGELGLDTVGASCLTLAQLRAIVQQVVDDYNVTPSKGLDGQSPALVCQRRAATRATPAFTDVVQVRRLLGKVVTALLTRDGIEVNGIRYRDAVKVQAALENLARTQAVRGRRKDGSVTVDVKCKVTPSNLDSIQFWDEVGGEWVELPSTQPEYTDRLSEWEHREFGRMAKRRNEPFASEANRLAAKRNTMRMIDEMAPHVGFQQRRTMGALYLSNQVKRLAGPVAAALPPVPIEGVALAPQTSVENDRKDDGLPATTSRAGGASDGQKRPQLPPSRVDSDEAAASVGDFDWDEVDVDAHGGDPEIGEEPVLDEDTDDAASEDEA